MRLALEQKDEDVEKLKQTVAQLERKLGAMHRSSEKAVAALHEKCHADELAKSAEVKRMKLETDAAKKLAGLACARFQEEHQAATKLLGEAAAMRKENVDANKRCAAAEKKAAHVDVLQVQIGTEKARVKAEKQRVQAEKNRCAAEQKKAGELYAELRELTKKEAQGTRELTKLNKDLEQADMLVAGMQSQLTALQQGAAPKAKAHTEE
eukprot:3823875-Pleurochrysis_carterae.AAC.1